jgi:hypothetical protein
LESWWRMLLNNLSGKKNCFWKQMLNKEVANSLRDCERKQTFLCGKGPRVLWTGCKYKTSWRFIIAGLFPQSLGRFEWQPSARLSQTLQPSYLSPNFAAATWVEHWHVQCSDCRNTLIYPHDLAHSPEVWHESRLAKITCLWSWRLFGINPDLPLVKVLKKT